MYTFCFLNISEKRQRVVLYDVSILDKSLLCLANASKDDRHLDSNQAEVCIVSLTTIKITIQVHCREHNTEYIYTYIQNVHTDKR